MTTSIFSPAAGAIRPGQASRILALMPLWVLLLVGAFSPDFLPAMGAKPYDMLGIPLALLLEIAAMLWMLMGAVVIFNSESRVLEALALTVFTIPATVVVVLTPAAIAVLQSLD